MNLYPEQLRTIANLCEAISKADTDDNITLGQRLPVVWNDSAEPIGWLICEVDNLWSFTAKEAGDEVHQGTPGVVSLAAGLMFRVEAALRAAADLYESGSTRWVCGMVRSGNGVVACIPTRTHDLAWGCGWRFEIILRRTAVSWHASRHWTATSEP